MRHSNIEEINTIIYLKQKRVEKKKKKKFGQINFFLKKKPPKQLKNLKLLKIKIKSKFKFELI